MTVTSPKPFVFVLMPFDSSFDDIYQLGIKPACVEAGAYGERVDEQIFDETILQRIINQIAKADIIVSDMTGKNPNVFYETGYAHALEKRVILLTQRTEDIPFDLKHHPHIVYNGRITDLKPELIRRITFALSHPSTSSGQYLPPLQMFLRNIPLVGNPVIVEEWLKGNYLYLVFNAKNEIINEIRNIEFQIAVITPGPGFSVQIEPRRGYNEGIEQPDGTVLHIYDEMYGILPGGWKTDIRVQLAPREGIEYDKEYQMVIRVFSEAAPIDFPFRLFLKRKEKGAR